MERFDGPATVVRGAVLNPEQCRGQVEGGTAQAIGSALLEQVLVGSDGAVVNPMVRTSCVPQMADAPTTELYFAKTSDELGPLGAKSTSENPYHPIVPALGKRSAGPSA